MLIRQFVIEGLGHISALVADQARGVAAVIDPRRDVDIYVEDAARRGLTIRHVILTHFHADFVSGHLELAARCGATIHMGARAQAEFAFQAHRTGDEIDLGGVRLRVLETPGHTPESITLLLFEETASSPTAMFTGDTLFIGDVGRPDLLASVGVSAEELASMMYDSLHDKILPLPDATVVYPAHGAGSACGKNISADRSSTLGAQKASNWALQPMTRERFIGELTAAQPAAPAYFAFDADLNRRARATIDEVLDASLRPVPLAELLRLANAGAVVLDTRDPDDYAKQHLAGSTNIGLGGQYARWAGELLRSGQSIVLVAEPGRERESATRLARIGFDRVVGYLDGGPSAFAERPELLRSHPRIDAAELQRRLASKSPPHIVDVRAISEWQAGHVHGSQNEPLPELRELAKKIPRDRPLVVHCLGGYRSSIACSLLEQAGFEKLTDLEGGWNAWIAAQGEVAR